MKYLILIGFLVPCFARAEINILISYFDAFHKAPFNNSERIALELKNRFEKKSLINISLCSLPTIYDEAFLGLEDCLKTQKNLPDLVLSLGEGGCDLKLETSLQNNDHSYGPDNLGQERFNSPIILGAQTHLPLKYPMIEMYCSIKKISRNSIIISKSAGSFVCNNTAYKMRYYYPNVNYGFIHVPAHDCFMLQMKSQQTIQKLEVMIQSLVNIDLTQTKEILINSDDIRSERAQRSGCERDFYDELQKRGHNLFSPSATN
jgi:pyrrolidone-carboxylate peptidase